MSIDTSEHDDEAYEFGQEFSEQKELLKPVTTEDIRHVIDTIKKEASHDEVSIKQLLLGMLSAFTKTPIHHAVSSKDPGAGKSYLLVLVAGYIPKEYVVSLAGMSDKAMLHKQGIMVVEENGELIEIEPIIQDAQLRIEAIDKVQSPSANDKAQKKELEVLIRDTRKNAQKLIMLENKVMLLLDTTQDTLFKPSKTGQ
jgi:hypothetical protein